MRRREDAIGMMEFELSLKDECNFNRRHGNTPCRGHTLEMQGGWEDRGTKTEQLVQYGQSLPHSPHKAGAIT